jgi:hypothetical protein
MKKSWGLGMAVLVTAGLGNLSYGTAYTIPSGVTVGDVSPDVLVKEFWGDASYKHIFVWNSGTDLVGQFYVDCGSAQTVNSFILHNMKAGDQNQFYNIYDFKIYTAADESGTFDYTQASSYDLANPVYSGNGTGALPYEIDVDRTATLTSLQTKRFFLFEVVSNGWIVNGTPQTGYPVDPFTGGSMFYNITPVIPEPVSLSLFAVGGLAMAARRAKTGK